MTVAVRRLEGESLGAALEDVARLRIAVFRDWPYLYDGDLDYERQYLQVYRDSPGAILVGAFDGPRLVGASTGAPGIPLEEIFYCAESVLLPAYRGQGLGHRFFDLREAHARALGRRHAAFCSVIRPETHPARPPDARKNDAFWRKRGYAPLPGAIAQFSWKDLGEAEETRKPLQFWMRAL
jgi:GNAT superfamily N-acetyltransferase